MAKGTYSLKYGGPGAKPRERGAIFAPGEGFGNIFLTAVLII